MSDFTNGAHECFCDRKYKDANKLASCGDCPRDYIAGAWDARRKYIEEHSKMTDHQTTHATPRRTNMSADTTTLTPKQREAIYEAWIAALRSGRYKQGRHRLEHDGEFCCLGVLCHVLHQRPELGIKMDRLVIPGEATEYSTPARPGNRSRVPYSSMVELGLSARMPSSAAPSVVESVLTYLNDIYGASFAEIAQFIEGSVMPLLRAEGILPPAQQEAPEKDHGIKAKPNLCRLCGHEIYSHDRQYGCSEDGCDCETPSAALARGGER